MPPVETWDTFPFDGELRPRALQPPVEREEPRRGEGGVDCWRCTARRQRVRLGDGALAPPRARRSRAGFPSCSCSSRARTSASRATCPTSSPRSSGCMIARIERAIRSIGEIGRVHVCRWGDGGEHLHWWFMARPARLPQLIGSFAAIWDDVLPPTPPRTCGGRTSPRSSRSSATRAGQRAEAGRFSRSPGSRRTDVACSASLSSSSMQLVVARAAAAAAARAPVRARAAPRPAARRDGLPASRQHEQVRAAVVGVRHALDETAVDEPLDVVAQRRRRHARGERDGGRAHGREVANVREEREQVTPGSRPARAAPRRSARRAARSSPP